MGKLVTVKGVGHVSIAPDTVSVFLQVITVHADYAQAIQAAKEKIAQLENVITAQDFSGESLKTHSFSVDVKEKSELKEDVWQTEQIGYEVSQTVELQFSLDQNRLEKLLANIAETKVQPVISLQFTVKDRLALQKQLLENATSDACYQAEVLAQASNVVLGELVEINHSPTNQQTFLSPVTFQTESRQVALPTIHPAMIEETIEVNFCWKLKNK